MSPIKKEIIKELCKTKSLKDLEHMDCWLGGKLNGYPLSQPALEKLKQFQEKVYTNQYMYLVRITS